MRHIICGLLQPKVYPEEIGLHLIFTVEDKKVVPIGWDPETKKYELHHDIFYSQKTTFVY